MYTKKVDIWALGLTFYYLLTGELPTTAKGEGVPRFVCFREISELTVEKIHTWLSKLKESPIKELLNIMLNPNDTLNNNQTGQMNMDFICDSERPWMQYLIDQVRLARSKRFHIGYCNQLGINLEINQEDINNTDVLPANNRLRRSGSLVNGLERNNNVRIDSMNNIGRIADPSNLEANRGRIPDPSNLEVNKGIVKLGSIPSSKFPKNYRYTTPVVQM